MQTRQFGKCSIIKSLGGNMALPASTEFTRIENWLTLLITTYKQTPSYGLAQTICYYLNKLLNHDDFNYCKSKRCDYLSMHRYWRWQSQKR